MTTKLRGYALIEMLIIMSVLVVFMALSVKSVRTLVSGIPRSNRVYQVWNTTNKAMKQLKDDVEKSHNIVDLRDDLLTLQNQNGRITYKFSDGTISRHTSLDDSEAAWKLPYVKAKTQLWTNDGSPYAVQITTWSQQIISGEQQALLKQSFVYFQKGLGQAK